jgi:RNA polymerase sigma factor (sigma-70 family)
MATGRLNHLLHHLRRAALPLACAGLTDGQLLEAFLARRDEAALEALVRRHGPMAWGVCRRILCNHHDAEDAFQATFLVLVRRAASVVPRETVANWLYGVAYRTALKARATAARRRVRERQVSDMPEPATSLPDVWHDLRPLLDEELSRLPDKYRVPVVLCDLEGRTRKDVARQLGWPEGTVAGRLARARQALAAALARRGVVLSGGALAVVLSSNAAAAPTELVGSTINAAKQVAAGLAAGAVSVRVAALTEEVLRSMVLSQHKTALVVFLVALLGLGGGALGWQTRAAENGPTPQQAGRGESGAKRNDDNLKNTLLALDRHLWEAHAKGEWREFEKFYAPELLGVSIAGKSGRAANIEAVKNLRVADWKIRDIDVVRVSPDAAVLTYIYSCKVLSPDGRLVQMRREHRATYVWTQRNGGWVLVFCHDEYGRQPGTTPAGILTNYYREVEMLRRATKEVPEPDPVPKQ